MTEIEKHLAESGKAKWEEIKTEIAEVSSLIKNGTIKVTNAQNGEEFKPANCPNVTIK